MPGWLRPEPISEDDWSAYGDTVAVSIDTSPRHRCPDCGLELRHITFHYASERPLDDCVSTLCVQCSGIREIWGRIVATDRETYEDPVRMAMLEAYLGPRHLWLSPFMN